jgi:hypothetical protein
MPTLILSPRYSDDSVKLWRAALELGWEVERFARWRYPDGFAPEEPVVFGEPLFNAVVAEQLNLELLEPPIDFLVRLDPDDLQRTVRITTAAEARRLSGPLFVKPAAPKTFAARVYACGAELPELPEDEPVLISDPVEWEAEFRFFVCDRTVRTWSPYWLRGALAREGDTWIVNEALARKSRALVDRLLANEDVSLPDALVIDAGVLASGAPAIVEANAATGAGLYGCRPVQVLDVLRTATRSNRAPANQASSVARREECLAAGI